MAVTDSYATAAEYRARVNKTDTGDDTAILAQATAVSRYIDNKLRRFFTQDATATPRYYEGFQEKRIQVDDIASTTNLAVKIDLDGDYAFTTSNETLTLNDHFFLWPYNAAKGSEAWPWTHLEVVSNNAIFTVWPKQARAVEVTAIFGWPAVPAAIKEATVSLTRYMRDLQEAGTTLAIQEIDFAVQQSPMMQKLMTDLWMVYGRKILTFG